MTAERSSEDNDGHQDHATIGPRGSAPCRAPLAGTEDRRASGLIDGGQRFNRLPRLGLCECRREGKLPCGSGQCVSPLRSLRVRRCSLTQAAHAVVAVLFIALILGHIYIGTLGMEGAFEAMGTGEVDLDWAKEHHDRWLAQQLADEDRQRLSATPAE
jgi:hypothetical protein